ncbi:MULTISPECIES: ThiF family adenylyltransferase [Aeromicrobium]|uniref:ThiF family adenylyltransferase n=1 Tax=Aeromicrobium TaxID=2040 RepID=UPI0025804C03|nr:MULTISPECIES: ThiF family adenylyltransferase [Aeromicrobium]
MKTRRPKKTPVIADRTVARTPAPRWQITDEALAILDRELATPAPECGAALLAPADTRLVVDVIVDPVPGEQVSYWHSPRLGELLNARIADSPLLRYVGTAHSHPGGMAWPSLPDHQAFSSSVAASGLEAGLFPIVVATASADLRMPERFGTGHLVDLAHGTLAPYTWRTTHGLDSCRVSVMPLRGSIEAALAVLAPSLTLTAGATVPVEGIGTAWLLVPLEGDTHVDLLVPQSYPESAPLIRCGEGEFTAPRWDLSTDLGTRLAEAIHAVVGAAARADLPDARAGIGARLSHHIPTSDGSAKHVAILGCGSVGSTIAELLVRAGVEAFTLVDPDEVSAANLSRGAYAYADVGRAKVDALASRLSAIAPHAVITLHAAALAEDAADLLGEVDLAIMVTDDPAAEAWHSHVLYDAGIPYVSAKLFAKADAGEIAFVVPGASTACLACATGMTAGGQGRGAVNYGTGRLDGEPALGADITAVSARATRTALALLHRDTPGPLADWIAPLLEAGRTLNLSCSVPGWGIFEHVAVPPMDGPFASVWAKTASQPTCAVCGPDRVPPATPLAAVAPPEDLDALLESLAAAPAAVEPEAGSVVTVGTATNERQ